MGGDGGCVLGVKWRDESIGRENYENISSVHSSHTTTLCTLYNDIVSFE